MNAGTHAQVYVTAYGSKGASNSLPLSSKTPDDFDRDKESEFKVRLLMECLAAIHNDIIMHKFDNSVCDLLCRFMWVILGTC